MGSAAGVLKVAADRVGLSLDAYTERVAAGEKWCTGCKAWHPRKEFDVDRSRSDGLNPRCPTHRRRRYSETYVPSGRTIPRGRRYAAARDGDKKQARARVNYLVFAGLLPDPDEVACADCGHLGEGPRHEYDHHRGYAAEHHETVEAVCAPCHHERSR